MFGHISNFSDLLATLLFFDDLLASLASYLMSVQDKGSSEERENEATAAGIEHCRDAKGGQFWTG